MKSLKLIFLILLNFFLITSCSLTYDFTAEKSAADQIIEDLKTKKIVFIGENHNEVYPILFLTEHMQEFYDAGVRYLFLEGGFRRLHENYSYDFIQLETWMNGGWKYESYLFEEKILNLNSIHNEDPIKIIFPEEGHEISQATTLKTQVENLNSRDLYSSQNIIKILEKSKPEEKAIVFYGVNHGYKIMQKIYEYDWKSCSVYLDEHYSDNFTNYVLKYFDPKNKIDILLENDYECKVVPDKFREKICNKELSDAFDNICITKKEIFGVPYSYVPTEENINILLMHVKTGLMNFEKIKNTGNIYATSEYWQFLSSIYYLKYHFGNIFQFNYFMNLEELKKQVMNLENIIYSDGFNVGNFISHSYTIDELEKYSKYMFSYGCIEEYLIEPNKDLISDIISNLLVAKKINSHDIWPQYWISYFETEKAKYSGKKSDYKKALAEWNKLLENDLLYASPVLKLVYEKIVFCVGKIEKKIISQNIKESIYSCWDLDCKKLIVFGN